MHVVFIQLNKGAHTGSNTPAYKATCNLLNLVMVPKVIPSGMSLVIVHTATRSCYVQ